MTIADHAFCKTDWRKLNLEFIKKCAPTDRRGRLLHSYVELVGATGHEMFDIMRPVLSEPTHFVGVDVDPEVIFHHTLQRRPFRLAYGDFFNVANDAIKEEHSAAIFNYDGQEWLDSDKWWSSQGRALRETVDRSVEKNGTALVILNLTLTRRGEEVALRDVHLAQNADRFVKMFGAYNPKRAQIFHTKDYHAYYVYRSEKRIFEMATLRLVFHKGRVTAYDKELKPTKY